MQFPKILSYMRSLIRQILTLFLALSQKIETRKLKKFKCTSSQGRKIKSCQRIISKGDLVHVVLHISQLSRNSSFLCNTPYLCQNRKYKKHPNSFYHINNPTMTSTRNKLWEISNMCSSRQDKPSCTNNLASTMIDSSESYFVLSLPTFSLPVLF